MEEFRYRWLYRTHRTRLATMQQVEPLKAIEADRKRMVIDESIKPKFAD
ncbi:hypothetical protein LRP49_04340 [Enterovibrio sp. ZSDZ35]|uniref:Transposase n=1 Tax=Enterovibrio qingdaonensis TaxID=2899818 RepID=A0ABT5QHU3_9GAMM|nr:hypothetical protein [Enterovibrio sp. ZSDZ35]MDD1780424.1 hypothetical protein [Enterovibrio sp. ZSDZ35]